MSQSKDTRKKPARDDKRYWSAMSLPGEFYMTPGNMSSEPTPKTPAQKEYLRKAREEFERKRAAGELPYQS